MVDVAADRAWMGAAVSVVHLIQMVVQARWICDSPLSILPHVETHEAALFG